MEGENEPYTLLELQNNDETCIDGNLLEESIENNIKVVSDYMLKIEEYRQMTKEINDALKDSNQLSQAGSIIFWDKERQAIVTNGERIVEELSKNKM